MKTPISLILALVIFISGISSSFADFDMPVEGDSYADTQRHSVEQAPFDDDDDNFYLPTEPIVISSHNCEQFASIVPQPISSYRYPDYEIRAPPVSLPYYLYI